MTTPALTAADCERIFHAALSKGDTKGVEAALVGLAVRDPHRAQDLLDITKVALKVASDPTLRTALLTSLTMPAIPAGLDARPTVRYTLHCSHCGKPHEGEFGTTHWAADSLTDLGRWELDGWETNVDGRPLVCPDCPVGYCEHCIDKVYPWQEYQGHPSDDGVWHTGCAPVEQPENPR